MQRGQEGLMGRFIIENNIILQSDLKEFNEEGYSYNEYLSSDVELVFTRKPSMFN